MGQTVLAETKQIEQGQNRLEFDVSKWVKGVYFVLPSTNKVKMCRRSL